MEDIGGDGNPSTVWDCGVKWDVDFVGGGWNQQRRIDTVMDALTELQGVRKNNGASYIRVKESPSSGWADTKVEVIWDGGLGSNVNGKSLCIEDDVLPILHTAEIRLNPNLQDQSEDAALYDVAQHEFGHDLSLTHTGESDSYGGGGVGDETAVMSTCQALGAAGRVLGQDDVGSLAHKQDGSSKPPITANAGFEDHNLSAEWWGATGNSSLSAAENGSNAYAGDNYAVFTPDSSGDYMYQSMNYGESDGTAVDIALAFKNPVGSASGDIDVELYYKPIDYGDTFPTCGNEHTWPTGLNQNDRDDQTWIRLASVSASWAATTSWQHKNTSEATIDPDSGLHWDLRLRIYSTVSLSQGEYTSVWIDKARIRREG